jgi:hypothetical protein
METEPQGDGSKERNEYLLARTSNTFIPITPPHLAGSGSRRVDFLASLSSATMSACFLFFL